MTNLVLGIDGGGSTCRAALADPSGRIIGRGTSGPANILTDPEEAVLHIGEAAREAFSAAGTDPALVSSTPCYLGLAGSTVPRAVDAVVQRLPFQESVVESDGLIALEGALGDMDGSIAILGTGTIYFLKTGSQVETVGGWGFVIGDLGSGARIGQAAMQESILAEDGIRNRTPLTDSLIGAFGEVSALVDFARNAAPADFARFAPSIFERADTGDATALRVIRQAAHHVDEALDRLFDLGGPLPLCLLGGLAPSYRRWVSERHRVRLREPAADAVSGAVSLAIRHFVTRQGAAA